MTVSMHMASTHLPAQSGFLCIASKSSPAIRSAVGYRAGISWVGQICTFPTDKSGSGNGLGSVHLVMIREEAIVVAIDAAKSAVTSAGLSAVLGAVTDVVIGAVITAGICAVLGEVLENSGVAGAGAFFLRKENMRCVRLKGGRTRTRLARNAGSLCLSYGANGKGF